MLKLFLESSLNELATIIIVHKFTKVLWSYVQSKSKPQENHEHSSNQISLTKLGTTLEGVSNSTLNDRATVWHEIMATVKDMPKKLANIASE